MQKEELMNWIQNDLAKNADKEFGELVITAGAGDIDMMVEPIKKILSSI
jgi:UDP-N-acetylmuramate--alanine ligase